MSSSRWSIANGILIAVLAAALTATPTVAQDDPPPDGWTFRGELTSVLSSGNSDAFTVGLGSSLENRRGPGVLKLEGGALRTESSLLTRRAVGTPEDFEIEESSTRQRTAELYFLRGRYDREVSERVFAYGGLDWLRNTFAGIDSRLLAALGGGNIWQDRDDARFRTSYAATWTFQSDVVDTPGVNSNFPGVRLGWEYWRRATSSTSFESLLVTDLNLDATDDARVDFLNSMTVSISSMLALKPSLHLMWRNRPSLTEVDLFSPGGSPLGQRVLTPLESTDLLFRLALVVTL